MERSSFHLEEYTGFMLPVTEDVASHAITSYEEDINTVLNELQHFQQVKLESRKSRHVGGSMEFHYFPAVKSQVDAAISPLALVRSPHCALSVIRRGMEGGGQSESSS